MNGQDSVDRDAILDTLAADLTLAAYRVVLQSGTPGNWADIELGLWRELTREVRTNRTDFWFADGPSRPMPAN